MTRAYRLLDFAEVVAEVGHATLDEIRSDSRRDPLPRLRAVVYLLAREKGYSSDAVASLLQRGVAGDKSLWKAGQRLRLRLAAGDVDALRLVARAREALAGRQRARSESRA